MRFLLILLMFCSLAVFFAEGKKSKKKRPCTSVGARSSCSKILRKNPHAHNKDYMLKVGYRKIPVYCRMTPIQGCGGGGWTLVMKTDGKKSNKRSFNLRGGMTGFDNQETKLPTYWSTRFSKLCLGMRIGQRTEFILMTMPRPMKSLYSMIADGAYRKTGLGRNTWKKLIGCKASLQRNCNKEGFNAVCSRKVASKVRIGILGNQENACSTCDSRIGFGGGGYPDDSNTCGNEATWKPDNGIKHIKTFGYILVQ